MKLEIEKYLTGEMTEVERLRFEAELAENADLRAELERERHFLERLKTQLLREKIAAALAEGKPVPAAKKMVGRHWLPLAWLLPVAAAAVWFFILREKNAAGEAAPSDPVRQEQAPENQSVEPAPPTSPPTSPPTPKGEQTQAPIADEKDIAPAAGQPGLRGKEGEKSAWNELVASVWQLRFDWHPEDFPERFAPIAAALKGQEFPVAYVELQALERESPRNDTLVFLKAHCLTAMREGTEALQYLDRLSGVEHPWQWEAEWLEGLCYLLIGEKTRAEAVLKTVAATPGHPYRVEAQAALQQMKKVKK